MRLRPRTLGLRGRIAWGVFVAVLLSSAAASAFAYVRLASTATEQFEQQAQRQVSAEIFGASTSAQQFTRNSGNGPDNSLDDVFTASFQNFFIANKTYAVVVLKPQSDGSYTFARSGPGDSNTLHTTAHPGLVAATHFPAFTVANPGSDAWPTQELHVRGHWYAVGGITGTGTAPGYFQAPVVAVDYLDMTPLDHEIDRYRTSLLAVTATAALIAAAFAWLLAGVIQSPVRRAAVAARRFGQGDRAVRLPVQGRDASAELAEDFNTMADELSATVASLEASEERQRRFVADVAHELRTPMTALVAGASALEDPVTRDRAATIVAPQVRRLGRLTEDLVETSLIDDGTAPVARERVDVHAVVLDVVGHGDDPVGVRVTGGGDAVADVDPRRVHTVLRNLVANAVRHGEPPVSVHVDGDDTTVRVTVEDHGPGLPADLGDRVFERFVRGDPARSGPGTGLGLSLARDNAVLNGGSLVADRSEAGGARFVLTLPREAPADASAPPPRSPRTGLAPPRPPEDDGHRSWRWALAAAVVGLMAGGAIAVAVTGAQSNTRPTAAPSTETSDPPGLDVYQRLFDSDDTTVLAMNAGPEGTTIDLVQATSADQGVCTTVRVSTPSADRTPLYGCDPTGSATQPGVSDYGASWSWVSPTSGLVWSGWYGETSTAATVELRVDDHVVGTATPRGGYYVLNGVQDNRSGCRTIVSRDAAGGIVDVEYTNLSCDPSMQTPGPGG